MIERRLTLRGPLDLPTTLSPLAHGRGDRTIRIGSSEVWLAVRTPSGPATVRIVIDGHDRLRATGWGNGAADALDGLPALVGELDEPERFVARHPVVRRLQRAHRGLRMPRTGRILHALVPSILEQKVTGTEAFRSYAALLRAHGEPAPGPAGDLLLPPDATILAHLPYHALHPLGIERRRADTLRRAAARADWLEAPSTAAEAGRRMRSIPGIGPWTAAEVLRSAFGDADAVSVGDYHIPNTVAWALAGEARATDARMLELLEPYRGQRGRVQRLLEVGGVVAPRFGPRMAPRRIATI